MDQKMNLGDEVDMEMQEAVYEKEEMMHVRMNAYFVGWIWVCTDATIHLLNLITSYT